MAGEPRRRDLTFSVAEYKGRLARVCEAMDARGLDVLVCFGIQFTLPGHVTWIAGSEPRLGLTKAAMAVVLRGRSELIVLGRAEPDEIWVDDFRFGFDFVPLLQGAIPSDARRAGIAGWELFPARVYAALVESYPRAAFEPASDLLLELRKVKSAAEVEVMRRGARIAQAGVEAMYGLARPGLRERDLLAEYERAVRANGSDELPFATQVAGGPRTGQVTAHATDRVIEDGDIVRSDSGALYRGYCSDISRGTVVGTPSPRTLSVIEAAAEVYETCLARIAPGVHFAELVETARLTAARHGFTDELGTLTVHGIGCNQDEYPHWSTGAAVPSRWTRGPGQVEQDTGFLEGMVCCFEPGIYVEGLGGLRLEEPFVVTRAGAERLTNGLRVRLWERV
jgi:Xaa-Pro aminopeptidase